jgi:hypothetical protein
VGCCWRRLGRNMRYVFVSLSLHSRSPPSEEKRKLTRSNRSCLFDDRIPLPRSPPLETRRTKPHLPRPRPHRRTKDPSTFTREPIPLSPISHTGAHSTARPLIPPGISPRLCLRPADLDVPEDPMHSPSILQTAPRLTYTTRLAGTDRRTGSPSSSSSQETTQNT